MKKLFWQVFFVSILAFIIPNISQAAVLDGLACLKCGGCNFADFAAVFYSLINFLLGAMGAVALVFFIWGGLQWLVSGGSAERVNNGKQIMINTIFAIILAFGGGLLVKFFIFDVLNVNMTATDIGAGGVCGETGIIGVIPEGSDCTSAWEGGLSCGGNCAGFTTGGIDSRQCQDASPSLQALLTCLMAGVNNSAILNSNDIIITSISQDVGLANCRDNWRSPPCVHARNSCHYGGPALHKDGSYGADIRSTILGLGQMNAVRDIIQACGGNYLYHPPSDPPTHIHISTSDCGAI